MQVHTTKGLVDIDRLDIRDIVQVHDNARNNIVEWYLEGEMVRRDVFVNILRGIASQITQENL